MPPSRSRQQYDDDFDDDYEDGGGQTGPQGEAMRRLLLDLLGRWYWIALFLILGLLGAGYYLSKAPKKYSATSTLLIKTQTSSVMSRDQVEDIDLRSVEAMNTTAARVARMDLLERVAARQDVRDLPGLIPPRADWRPNWWKDRNAGGLEVAGQETRVPPPQALGGMIGSWMSISIRKYTRLLDISVSHPVPEVSKAIADAIALEFQAEVAAEMTAGRSGAIDLLVKQSEEARDKLQTANSALATYSRTLEVHQLLDSQEAAVSELRRVYLPGHPKMQIADSELERLKQRFISEFKLATQAPADESYWQSAQKLLPNPNLEPERYLRIARQQVLARILVLKSEIESQTSVFNTMLTRIEESSVNQESQESSTEIDNLARVPGGPSGPIANKVYSKGGAGGAFFGLLIAFILTRIDNKFHTVAQLIAETGQTALASISDIVPAHLAVAEKKHFKKHPEDDSELYDNWEDRLVFRPGTANTSYAEMYRVLRASISLLGDEKTRKVTLFSSALPGEGKTSTSANFALAAAGQMRKTLLIDLDLRKPSVHKAFGRNRQQEKGGITECLAGLVPIEEVVLTDLPEKNLHVILSGKRAPNPGELLDTGRLQTILDWARQHYDLIVLDTAPLLAVPDTRIVAPLADNVCLVVRANYVPKGAVRRVQEILDEDGTQLSGIIFNGFREKRRLMGQNYSYGYYKTSRYGRAYQYGYGSYGSYGSEEEEDEKPRKNRRNRRRRRAKS